MKSKNLNLSDLSKRFLKVLDEKNISGYRLSKDVDEITESKLTFIRTGRNEPSKILINALLNKFTDISRIWLLTGEGEMFKNSENNEVNDNEIEYNTPKSAIKIKDDEIVVLKKIIKDKEQIIDLLHQKIEFLEISCNCAQKKTTA